MRPAGILGLISGWLLCTSAVASAAVGGVDSYAIGEISSDILPSQKIGKIKQGFICAPKGALKFGQLRQSDSVRVKSRIDNHDAARGHRINLTDAHFPFAGQAATYVLVGKIDSVELDICVPGTNIGIGSRKLKGGGTIVVTWEIWRQADKSLSSRNTVHIPFDVQGVDPRQSSEVLDDYLAASAVQFLEGRAGDSAK